MFVACERVFTSVECSIDLPGTPETQKNAQRGLKVLGILSRLRRGIHCRDVERLCRVSKPPSTTPNAIICDDLLTKTAVYLSRIRNETRQIAGEHDPVRAATNTTAPLSKQV